MSFVDLATLTMHRRSEMEARIGVLEGKCDQAQNNIRKLLLKAQTFLDQLNCEPSQLKDRFLSCMNQLDEYIYLITDFNLSVGKFEKCGVLEYMPVHDAPTRPMSVPPAHLLDVLSEPIPSTSATCANQCPSVKIKTKRHKMPTDELLIEFSSTSCSQESVPEVKSNTVEKDVQHEKSVIESNKNSENGTQSNLLEMSKLPAQTVLQTNVVYNGCIIHIDGGCIWIITEGTDIAYKLMNEMTNYYNEHNTQMTTKQLRSLTYCYCAYYDDDTNCSYRCLFLKFIEDKGTAELFLVDTGEVRCVPTSVVYPLDKKFCEYPPFARCCHLAGVELIGHQSKEMLAKQDEFLRQFVGKQCEIEVDDNSSESLGIYIYLSPKKLLNDLVVEEGLAVPEKLTNTQINVPEVDEERHNLPSYGPPEFAISDSALDITDCPEYEDVLEAVTGYHNRDEEEICKHYKGGAERTCFKGSRCKKKHIMKHPEGWTLDKVKVAGKGKLYPLPEPGTWHKVLVTCVCHFDHVYIRFLPDSNDKDKQRAFGVVMPPMSLENLINDMNSPATNHRTLKLSPAPGELVAARYGDNKWYRALVISLTNHDQSVEVRYVDYGEELWIKEKDIRELDLAYSVLPFQAVRCKLAGVAAKSIDPEQWVEAKKSLQALVENNKMEAHIITRNYDELEIELYDSEGFSIAERLAANNMVKLQDYTVQEDSYQPLRVVVP